MKHEREHVHHAPQMTTGLHAKEYAQFWPQKSTQFHRGCPKGGGRGARTQGRLSGMLSASWSWDLLYFKGWRLAVGVWRLAAVGGGWWLEVGGWWRLVVGSWWQGWVD